MSSRQNLSRMVSNIFGLVIFFFLWIFILNGNVIVVKPMLPLLLLSLINRLIVFEKVIPFFNWARFSLVASGMRIYHNSIPKLATFVVSSVYLV